MLANDITSKQLHSIGKQYHATYSEHNVMTVVSSGTLYCIQKKTDACHLCHDRKAALVVEAFAVCLTLSPEPFVTAGPQAGMGGETCGLIVTTDSCL